MEFVFKYFLNFDFFFIFYLKKKNKYQTTKINNE